MKCGQAVQVNGQSSINLVYVLSSVGKRYSIYMPNWRPDVSRLGWTELFDQAYMLSSLKNVIDKI
jgi:hypothetical protein